MATNRTNLCLETWDTSEGTWIIFFGSMEGDFLRLQQIFQNLSHSPQDVKLHLQPFIDVNDDVKIHAVSTDATWIRERGKRLGIQLMGPSKCNEYEWRCTFDEWSNNAELLERLVKWAARGHVDASDQSNRTV